MVTRNGKPAAVILRPEALAQLKETIDVLSDPQALADPESRHPMRGVTSFAVWMLSVR